MEKNISLLVKSGIMATLMLSILVQTGLSGLFLPIPTDFDKRISKSILKLTGEGSRIVYDLNSSGDSGKHFKITRGENNVAYGCIREVNSCRGDICGSASGETIKEGYEFFEYFIITDTLFRVIHIEVFNYQATKGHEIMSRSWLKQFIGYDDNKSLIFGKDIDGMSGATISARSITADIAIAVKAIKENSSGVKPELKFSY